MTGHSLVIFLTVSVDRYPQYRYLCWLTELMSVVLLCMGRMWLQNCNYTNIFPKCISKRLINSSCPCLSLQKEETRPDRQTLFFNLHMRSNYLSITRYMVLYLAIYTMTTTKHIFSCVIRYNVTQWSGFIAIVIFKGSWCHKWRRDMIE